VIAFAAYLGAARKPSRARQRALVFGSVAGHLGLLAVAASLASRPAPAAPPPQEPIVLRLSVPPPRRSSQRPPAPRVARSARRPRLTQPVEVPPPPPELSPEAPAEEVEEQSAEEAEAPAGETGPPAPPGPAAPGVVDAPFELRDVARPPAVVSQITPVYPRDCRLDRVEGTVVVRVIVGRDGAVERGHVRVVRSVPRLDAAAIAAIEGWRFTPALGPSGQPVRVIIEVPFQFYLR
jgi:protein TonB